MASDSASGNRIASGYYVGGNRPCPERREDISLIVLSGFCEPKKDEDSIETMLTSPDENTFKAEFMRASREDSSVNK
jgi:hypothetical protein